MQTFGFTVMSRNVMQGCLCLYLLTFTVIKQLFHTWHQFDYLLCLQEIRYLDQVLDAASETPTNGNSSPSEHIRSISIDGNSPSICMSASSPVNHQSVMVEGPRQTTFFHQEDSAVKTNGHVQGEESGRGGPKFELRAFQEERRPAKLFTPGEEQQVVRVTRRRPTEEVNGR